jgi:GT2 family glycosyltransferase
MNGAASSSQIFRVPQPNCRLDGWFLPAVGTSVHGIRVRCRAKEFSAKRKQIRPDILQLFPERADALLSGFTATIRVPGGLNEVQLEFKDKAGEWHTFGTCQVRLPRLWRLHRLLRKTKAEDAYERWLRHYEVPSAKQLKRMAEASRAMKRAPAFTVVMLASEGTAESVDRSNDSVRAQAYPFWKLCGPERGETFSQIGGTESDYAVLLSPGDLLAPQALYQLAEAISRDPDAQIFFSEEDCMDDRGKHHNPRFHGSWDAELLQQASFGGGLLAFRTKLLQDLGGWRAVAELGPRKILELAAARVNRQQIRLIPHVLYHRYGAGLAGSPAAEAARVPPPSPAPLVSLIVPTHDRADLLRVALDSLFAKTRYPHLDIIIIDHASDDAETVSYLRELPQQHANVRVIRAEGLFNWSRLNNLGAKEAKGDVLLFLNNDVETIEEGWLEELVGQACRPDVGAVGACLLYPNGTIQHAGIVLGMTGLAGHVFRTLKPDCNTLAGRPDVPREVTAVTGACLAVRRSVFQEVGGFDEQNLPVSYNDVDFCLKLRARGLRNLYTPFARLIHHESVSRRDAERESERKAAASEEARIVLKRWPAEFRQDAFYSPNLSLDHEIPTLGDPPPGLSDAS